MPELPDVLAYVDHLNRLFRGRALKDVRLASPFVVRTAVPPLRSIVGRALFGVSHLAKRIVFEFEDDLYLVLHLMIAGRLKLGPPGAKPSAKIGLAAFDFDNTTLFLTEASTKRRASLHLVKGRAALAEFERGGLDPLTATLASFRARLRAENHTLKRALTDQTVLSGVGNAYSDEILHAARLSPLKQTQHLTELEWEALFSATGAILRVWIERLGAETAFPENVTAFRPEMAVHGRYGEPCPVCGAPVQRIVYATNETNYCPPCQTEGRLLADRSLSRLLGKDWPKSLEELEEKRPAVARAPNPKRSTKRPAKSLPPKA